MLNMLKMYFRRIMKSKSFYLTMIIFLLFSGYCIYSQAKWQVINGSSMPDILRMDSGLYSVVDYYFNMPLQFMYIFILKNGMIIFGIYIVSFIASDYQSGFLKNACMLCKNRSSIIWIKLLIYIIISIIIVLLSFLLATGLGWLFVDDFRIGSIHDILIFSGISVLLYVAFFSGITCLYRLIKNKIPSILLCVFFPLGLTLAFLKPLLGEYTKYTLSSIFLNLPMQFQHPDSSFVIIVCISFIVIYQIFSISIFNKRDI